MKQNITPQQAFIRRVKERYGDAFTFEKLVYINNKTPCTVTCKKHGDWDVIPGNPTRPRSKGCPYCSGALLHVSDFLAESKRIHKGKYDYSEVEFINSTCPVKVICPDHGPFFPRPAEHMRGTKCFICAMAETRLSTEAFLQKAKELFGDTYDLSNVTFGNTDDVIELECKSHGPFTKRVSSFLEGYGCKRCSDETMMRPKEDFVREAKEIHGDAFDYSDIDYKGMRVKITLNCPIHGEFTKTPLEHIQAKAGCPRCKESIGEREVRLWLERNGKKYIPEYSFPDYKYRWDFYVPEQALMIEFHGKQHFVPVERFGGLEGHLGTVKRDKEKLALVKEMGLSQLTISCFDKRTVDEILDEFFAE